MSCAQLFPAELSSQLGRPCLSRSCPRACLSACEKSAHSRALSSFQPHRDSGSFPGSAQFFCLTGCWAQRMPRGSRGSEQPDLLEHVASPRLALFLRRAAEPRRLRGARAKRPSAPGVGRLLPEGGPRHGSVVRRLPLVLHDPPGGADGRAVHGCVVRSGTLEGQQRACSPVTSVHRLVALVCVIMMT